MGTDRSSVQGFAPLSDCDSQGWAKPKLGARNAFPVLYMATETQVLGLFSAVFPTCQQEVGLKIQSQNSKRLSSMKCQCCRSWLNLPHPHSTPSMSNTSCFHTSSHQGRHGFYRSSTLTVVVALSLRYFKI